MPCEQMKIRKPAVAGAFYPDDKEELSEMIQGFLSKVPEQTVPGELKAIIVPHAGYEYSGQVAACAYSLLKAVAPKKILIVGPSHYAYFFGAVGDTNEYWETPLGMVKVTSSGLQKFEEAHIREHSIEVQVPFLQSVLKDFEIMPVTTGDDDSDEIAEQIKPFLKDHFLVVSSDLSHFHSYADASKLDKATCGAIETIDLKTLKADGEACGMRAITATLRLAKELGWKCKLLCYKNSGDVTGDKTKVVGYASMAFYT
ncbi:MAG: AmmeMemoRadiSam system protein B [Candidatus Woesearchaeota archaeon]